MEFGQQEDCHGQQKGKGERQKEGDGDDYSPDRKENAEMQSHGSGEEGKEDKQDVQEKSCDDCRTESCISEHKKGRAKLESYLYFSMTRSEANAIRKNIYKEIGVSKALPPQYNCWLIANYVSKNITYTSRNAASWMELSADGKRFKEGDIYCMANAIYTLYLGEGVCANYTQVTEWLLNGCKIVNSIGWCEDENEDDHGWNQVYITGKWYNLDVTFGDCKEPKENNGEMYYMKTEQFLVPDFMHRLKIRKVYHVKKCKSLRFAKYLCPTVEPDIRESYLCTEVDGTLYYCLWPDFDDCWLTDKWKTL